MKRITFMIILLLLAVPPLMLTTGCFGSKGTPAGGSTLPPVTGNLIDTSSVQARKIETGDIEVTWQTTQPTEGGNVVLATVFFEENPLWGEVIPAETKPVPSINHRAVIRAADYQKAAVLIVHDSNNFADNDGLGFAVEQ